MAISLLRATSCSRVIGLAQGQLNNVSGIRDERSRLGGSGGHELCVSHL